MDQNEMNKEKNVIRKINVMSAEEFIKVILELEARKELMDVPVKLEVFCVLQPSVASVTKSAPAVDMPHNTIGGAYSIDKFIRIENDWGWWEDEQPSDKIKQRVEHRLDAENWKVDVVLSHTAPLKYEPREKFLDLGIPQHSVDKSTEKWLDTIEDRLYYDKWYCGHYHTNKTIDKMRFLYDSYLNIDDIYGF